MNDKKDIVVKTDYITEMANTQQICNMLMKTPHYSKMGSEGIFAIVTKAIKIGVDPMEALNGGFYYVKGKVEMSAQLMNALIREGKHSVTKDKKSDDTICILHGKRADTGDTWTDSYSLQDAQRAGLLNNPTWKSHPKSMLFARALSLLARQLFPDVIRGCYVEGEISFDPGITEKSPEPLEEDKITKEQYDNLVFFLDQVPDYKQKIMDFLPKKGLSNLCDIPVEMYEKIIEKAQEQIFENEE